MQLKLELKFLSQDTTAYNSESLLVIPKVLIFISTVLHS